MVTATANKDSAKQKTSESSSPDQKPENAPDPAHTKAEIAKSSGLRDKARRYLKPALGILLLAVIAVAAYFIWQHYCAKGLEEGFASGNGRIEAVELDIAAKSPGRISEMYADEGDTVIAGQVVARMDTDVLRAQLRQAQAQESQARNATNTAIAMVAQHESEQSAYASVVTQREAALTVAEKTEERTRILSGQHAASMQELDEGIARRREDSAAVAASRRCRQEHCSPPACPLDLQTI
jgi:HlyD family secretion protein